MTEENKFKNLTAQKKEDLHNKYDKAIQKFTLMSDTFMSVVFKDKKCSEELLNVILDRKITIIDLHTQYGIQSLRGRSVRLDIKAVDENGDVMNIEVQNDNEGAIPERTRFNSSLMDMELLKTGAEFSELPATYVIMITKNDVLGGGKPIYHIDRRIKELNYKIFGDRNHIIYINSKIQDDTPLGRLMHDMHCENAKDMYNKIWADKVDYYKNKERGAYEMCKIIEKIALDREKETRAEDIKRIMIKYNRTAIGAMEDLDIPEKEYPIYLKLLGLKE